MSADAVTSVWGSSSLSYAQRFVAMAIADVVNDAHHNEFWMTPDRLGQKVGMEPGNVRRKLCELVDAGVLEILEEGGGRGKSTRYRWSLSEPRQDYADTETASDATETASETTRNRVDRVIPSSYRTKEELKELNRVKNSAFDEFWKLYPRKREKVDARRAWDGITRKGIDPGEILFGLDRALPDWRKRSKEFVPYPASWLRAGGWEDEPDSLTDEQIEARLTEIWEAS